MTTARLLAILFVSLSLTVGSVRSDDQGLRVIRGGERLRDEMPAGSTDSSVRVIELVVGDPGPITIEVRSLDFDTQLRVVRFGEKGDTLLVGEDDDGGFGTNSRLGIAIEGGGRYHVEVRPALPTFCGGDFEIAVILAQATPFEPAAKDQGDKDYWKDVQERASRSPNPARRVEAACRRARFHQDRGEYAEARTWAEDAVQRADSLPDPDLLLTARSLNQLATALQILGSYPEAKPLSERALSINERILGPDHLEVSTSLNNLAMLLRDMGEYAEAKPLLERSIAIREKTLSPDDPEIAYVLGNLGQVLKVLGSYDEARQLQEQALAIAEKRFGPESADVALILGDLGAVRWSMGDYAEARRLLERALAIQEIVLGPDHREVAISLNNLAMLLVKMGSYAEARRLQERTVAIDEKQFGPRHPQSAQALQNLANILWHQGEYEEARALLERALTLLEQSLGPEHPLVSMALNNLGALLSRMGHPAEAKPLEERALAIAETHFGPDSPALTAPLDNVARSLIASGSPEEARPFLERVLAIDARSLGPDHPGDAAHLTTLAIVEARCGRTSEALEAALRAEEAATELVRLTVRSLPERRALDFASVRDSGLDVALTLVVARRDEAAASVHDVLDALVRSRALVLDEMAARHRALAQTSDPEIARLAGQLLAARTRLANLLVRGRATVAPEQYRHLLETARREMETAEEALAQRSSTFRENLQSERAGLDEIARDMPPSTSLISYVRYQWCANTLQNSSSAVASWPGESPAHYLAFVLASGAHDPVAVPLGDAMKIDSLVARWKEEVLRGARLAGHATPEAEATYRAVGEALRNRIWDPVVAHVGDAQRVFVVPDGALNLVNLSALPVGRTEYLIEKGPLVHILSSERRLAAPATRGLPNGGMLVVGAPDYDAVEAFGTLAASTGLPETDPRAREAAPGSYRGPRPGCSEFQSVHFTPLPGAIREAREVASLWSESDARVGVGVVHLTGKAASEAAIKVNAPGRRVLHLATHAFFLGKECPSAANASRGIGGLTETDSMETERVRGESPLLLSGLALAGANHRATARLDQDDGILTAEEIAAMDLSGLEWAVLSACDTGLGEVRAGEGVFGLRRAFEIAGAGTVIMSLWPIEDDAARSWMRALYDARLRKKLDTAESVQAASLGILRARRSRGESTLPFWWAGFVAAGDWR